MKHYGIDMDGAFLVESVSSLPTWSASYQGRLIYLTTNNTLYYGHSGQWNPIAGGFVDSTTNFVGDRQVMVSDSGISGPIRRLHLAESSGSCEQVLEVADGLANWKKWNFVVSGGTGSKQQLNIRILDDAGSSGTHNALIMGSYVAISTWSPDSDPNPSSSINFYNGSGTKLASIWRSTSTSPDVTPNSNGRLSSGKIFNAVWNDIVDFLELEEELDEIQYGRVYVMDDNFKVKISDSYCQDGIIGIASDTYGFGVGSKNLGKKELPISIGGFVLAYVDKQYKTGTPLTCGPNGTLVEMNAGTKIKFPERIIATYLRPEKSDEWNGIKVNGRHWIKVR